MGDDTTVTKIDSTWDDKQNVKVNIVAKNINYIEICLLYMVNSKHSLISRVH